MRLVIVTFPVWFLIGCATERSFRPDEEVTSQVPAWYLAKETAAETSSSLEPRKQPDQDLANGQIVDTLHTVDQKALLEDCRRLTKTYRRYQSVFRTYVHASPAPVYLIDPSDPMLPRTIKALRPSRVAVTDARVNLTIGSPQHTVNLLAFAEGTKFESGVQQMFQKEVGSEKEAEGLLTRMGFTRMVDGLWCARMPTDP